MLITHLFCCSFLKWSTIVTMMTISAMPPMTEPAIIPGILPEEREDFKHIDVVQVFIFLSIFDLISVLMSIRGPIYHPLIHTGS